MNADRRGPWARLLGGASRSSASSSGGWAPARSSTACAGSTPRSLVAALACIAPGDHGVLRLALAAGRPRPRGRPVRCATAVASYYRSQFLNTTLPGGVVGDVHRGVRHGRDAGDVGRGLRAVAWERSAGQVVQVALTLLVLLAAAVAGALGDAGRRGGRVAAVLAVVLLACGRCRDAARRCWPRTPRRRADVRDGLLGPAPGPASCSPRRRGRRPRRDLPGRGADRRRDRVAGASCCRWRCSCCSRWRCRSTSAGWGPREGVAAWAFAAAGLGADQGVATAMVYGVMALVASLPGAVVLAVLAASRRRAGRRRTGRSCPRRVRAGGGRRMADRPVHPAQLRHVDRRLPRQRDRASGCCCPTTPTSTGSTPCGPAATRSSSAPRPSATTTRGCWCARPARRDERLARGLRPSPIKVTRDPARRSSTPCAQLLRHRRRREARLLRRARRSARPATGSGRWPRSSTAASRSTMQRLSEDLHARGVRRLMVEGGGTVHTQFLTADLADELHLVVAPFFVGDSRARRFVGDGPFPVDPAAGARRSPRCARSATSCCCATPSRPVRQPDRGDDARTTADRRRSAPRCVVPLRFGDGYATTARVFTFDGLVDGREHLAIGLGDRAAACGRGRRPAARPAAQRVPDRRRLRQRALRLRAAAARGGRADRRRRRLPALPAPGGSRASGSTASSTPTRCRTQGLDTYDANLALGHDADERDYTVAAQMLRALWASTRRAAQQQPGQGAPAAGARHRGRRRGCRPACTCRPPTRATWPRRRTAAPTTSTWATSCAAQVPEVREQRPSRCG